MDQSITTCMALGSTLPLVFASGRPACVDKMTLPQLRRFIPFMLKCEGQGYDVPFLSERETIKPSWWPLDLEFSKSILTTEEYTEDNLQNILRDIVRQCYENYSLSSILSLSSMLSNPKNVFGFVRVEENENGTSNVISCSNRLVVTTRTSVVKYDEDNISCDMNIVLGQSAHNRPVLKLVKSNISDRKYSNGRLKVPITALKSIALLNPRIKLHRAVFVSPKGQRVKYPFTESHLKRVFLPGDPSSDLEDNLFKVVVLSDLEKGSSGAKDNSNRISSEYNARQGGRYTFKNFIQDRQDACEDKDKSFEDLTPKTVFDEKIPFLDCLGLAPAAIASSAGASPSTSTAKPDPPSQRCEMILNQLLKVVAAPKKKKRSKKTAVNPKPKPVSSFFKTHRIPFTSSLGLELIRNSDSGRCDITNTNVDQFCAKRGFISSKRDQPPNVTTLKKNIIKDEDWVHSYSFTAKQKRQRNSELIVGLSAKSWPLLNLCRNVRVVVKEADPKDYQKLNKPRRVLPPGLIPGERPVIEIKDIYNNPKYAKYFQKNVPK